MTNRLTCSFVSLRRSGSGRIARRPGVRPSRSAPRGGRTASGWSTGKHTRSPTSALPAGCRNPGVKRKRSPTISVETVQGNLLYKITDEMLLITISTLNLERLYLNTRGLRMDWSYSQSLLRASQHSFPFLHISGNRPHTLLTVYINVQRVMFDPSGSRSRAKCS